MASSSAKYIYNKMYDYYGGQQFPAALQGRKYFFDINNFTEEKMVECIEFLQKNYGAGWLTGDQAKDTAVLSVLANDLYVKFDSTISLSGIYKFLCWVYAYAKKDSTAKDYFKGLTTTSSVNYYLEKAADTLQTGSNTVTNAVKAVVPDITSQEFTTGLSNLRTILKLLPVAAVAGLIGWALLTEKK